jgi:hypothetical protein
MCALKWLIDESVVQHDSPHREEQGAVLTKQHAASLGGEKDALRALTG